MFADHLEEIRINGIKASPGICIGKAYMVDQEGVDIVERYYIDKQHRSKEVKRFKAAVRKAIDELNEIITNTPEEFQQHTGILETHMVLLKDKMLYDKTIQLIEAEGINAEWALKRIVAGLKSMFRNISDTYLRGRTADIEQVSDRIMRNLVGADKVNIGAIDKRVILVARDLSPAETSQIQLERIKGFITDRGGQASHTGIIARTLEIPAVVGLRNATRLINNEDLLAVDGTNGVVVIHPSDNTLVEFEERQQRYEDYLTLITRESHHRAETPDGHYVPVMGNIELSEEVVSVRDHGGEGIGLYRTEFQYLSRSEFPTEDELFDKYREVVEVMAPLPVSIRTLDINGDKAIGANGNDEEPNPALGLRAIRYCLKNPELFKTQLKAILRAAVYGNVRIIFPLISNTQEVEDAQKLLQEAADELDRTGVPYNGDIEAGIMVEVPSAVILAEELAKMVDFFSIGTNDLIQYAFAIDRGNQNVAHMYQPLHPAIMRLLKQVADAARNNHIGVYMCGEMAGDPYFVPVLLGLGIQELSMNPLSIPAVKRVIRAIEADEAKKFVNQALQETDVKRITAMVEESYGSILAEQIYKA